jgi:hypothetical protein
MKVHRVWKLKHVVAGERQLELGGTQRDRWRNDFVAWNVIGGERDWCGEAHRLGVRYIGRERRLDWRKILVYELCSIERGKYLQACIRKYCTYTF